MKQFHSVLRPFIAFAALVILTTLSSCSSKQDKLLDTVPYDAEVVATTNLIELAEKAEISIEDGQVVLPPEYTYIRRSIPADVFKDIAVIAQSVDLEYIVVFCYINKNNRFFATAALTDADSFRSYLRKKDYISSRTDGLEVFASSDSDYADCFAISPEGDQVWFVPSRSHVSEISSFQSLGKNSITRYSGLSDALKADNIANIVVDYTAVQNTELSGYWSRMSLNIVNNAIVARFTSIQPDGEPMDFNGFQEISTDFLRYIPSNFIGAMAFGVNPDSEWTARVLDAISTYLTNARMSEMVPYVKAIDGTVAMGFGPRDRNSLLTMTEDGMQAIAMVHMNQQKVNELVSFVNSNMPRSENIGNGLYKINMEGTDLTYGSVDGYFAMAINAPLKSDNNNSFASDFSGKPFAAVVQTPMLKDLVNDSRFDYSIKAIMDVNGPDFVLQINLVGSEKPIIPTIIGDAPAFFEKLQAQIISARQKASAYVEPDAVVEEVDDFGLDTIAEEVSF